MPDPEPGEKYTRTLACLASRIDVYDVLEAFAIHCPAVQHAVKKLLCAGQRGYKDRLTDLRESAVAIQRAIEMEEQRGNHA